MISILYFDLANILKYGENFDKPHFLTSHI